MSGSDPLRTLAAAVVSSAMVKMQMPLLNEGTDVWRPVEVTPLQGAVYRVEGPQPDDEEWEFAPGTLIVCKWKKFSDGDYKLIPAAPAPTVRSSFLDHYKRTVGMAVGTLPLLLVVERLPRTSQGIPESHPLFLVSAGFASGALVALICLKPKRLAARWMVYSTLGTGIFMTFMALAN